MFLVWKWNAYLIKSARLGLKNNIVSRKISPVNELTGSLMMFRERQIMHSFIIIQKISDDIVMINILVLNSPLIFNLFAL